MATGWLTSWLSAPKAFTWRWRPAAGILLNRFWSFPALTGWTSQDAFPRLLADINNDGKADIVGFGSSGVFDALATGGGGFGSPQADLQNFGTDPSAGGWSSQDLFPRALGDVTGDGRADIVGFASNGVVVAQAANLFG
ncbi:MAG: VCBS repeat-containing protein [Alphaproteobacteria bacterium]|nr:VCBS repeat-containing protein [Alphaproteobacteria bacterium]